MAGCEHIAADSAGHLVGTGFDVVERGTSGFGSIAHPALKNRRLRCWIWDCPLTWCVGGMNGLSVLGGHLVQGIFKAQLFKQFVEEFKSWRKAGEIPEDFVEKKYGYQMWVE